MKKALSGFVAILLLAPLGTGAAPIDTVSITPVTVACDATEVTVTGSVNFASGANETNRRLEVTVNGDTEYHKVGHVLFQDIPWSITIPVSEGEYEVIARAYTTGLPDPGTKASDTETFTVSACENPGTPGDDEDDDNGSGTPGNGTGGDDEGDTGNEPGDGENEPGEGENPGNGGTPGDDEGTGETGDTEKVTRKSGGYASASYYFPVSTAWERAALDALWKQDPVILGVSFRKAVIYIWCVNTFGVDSCRHPAQ